MKHSKKLVLSKTSTGILGVLTVHPVHTGCGQGQNLERGIGAGNVESPRRPALSTGQTRGHEHFLQNVQRIHIHLEGHPGRFPEAHED